MREYILIFRLSKDNSSKPTPEQIKERMDWLGGIASQNKLADKGNTLSPNGAWVVGAEKIVTDGPLVENGQFVSGYMIVKSDTLDEALALAKANPIFKAGGSIEVREVAKLITGGDR